MEMIVLYNVYKLEYEVNYILWKKVSTETELENVYKLLGTEKLEVDPEFASELEYDNNIIIHLTRIDSKRYKIEHLEDEYCVISEKIFSK